MKHHKPSRQAYAYVERELGVEPCQLCLIACHAWDTLGAVAAGWEAALIKRLGNDVLGVGPQPQIVGDDLSDVAGQLITRDRWRASILNLWAIGTADRRRRAPVGRRFLSQYRLYAEQRRDLERADAYLTQPAAQFGTATGPVATDMARVRQRKCDMVPTLGRRSHGYGTNRDAGCTATHGTARRGYRSLTIAEGLGRLLAPRGGSRIGWLSMN